MPDKDFSFKCESVTLSKTEWDSLLRAEYEKAWQEGYDVGFSDGERTGFEAGTELGKEPDQNEEPKQTIENQCMVCKEATCFYFKVGYNYFDEMCPDFNTRPQP